MRILIPYLIGLIIVLFQRLGYFFSRRLKYFSLKFVIKKKDLRQIQINTENISRPDSGPTSPLDHAINANYTGLKTSS